jgi:spectinomycin phosphotransferase
LAVAKQLEGVRSVGAPVMEGVRSVGAPTPIAARHASFWIANADRIESLLARAQVLGRQLQGKRFEHILCHSDIHAANILVCGDGRIWLVDWDGPIIAPRERDLLFVVGSKIAGEVTPREEALFFQGYGPVEIDPVALAYFRYERIIEDIGEFGRTIFLQGGISEETRAATVRLVLGCFEPGGDIDRAEEITLPSFTAT